MTTGTLQASMIVRTFVLRDERGRIYQRYDMTFADAERRNAIRAKAPEMRDRLWGLLSDEEARVTP